ncbi:MAG: GNAT family N-acetyltransferase [Porphyromonadaceae bacterium]|nr:MAG: GNAT family N-acetyltransferase [Porphyromonadaceae bacterium]
MKTEPKNVTIRFEVITSDLLAVEKIVSSSGFFRPDEVPVAIDLVTERLEKGAESGYEFVIAEVDGLTVAYACFGLIPCTLYSYDLYWIATHEDYRGQGLGKIVLREVEKAITTLGGKTIYVETSYLPNYEPTRAFYLKNNYIEKARFEDFYNDGDDKVVYIKKL